MLKWKISKFSDDFTIQEYSYASITLNLGNGTSNFPPFFK